MYIDDLTGTLSSTQVSEIQNLTAPFDVKIVIVSTESKAVLDANVSSMVTSANTLAIGIDPVHHYTFTHFGIGTGVSRNDFQNVARSGNGDFKQGHWGEGIKTIISSATAARKEARETTTIVIPAQVTHVETAFPVMPVIIGALAILFGFFLIRRWNKKVNAEVYSTINDFKNEAQELRSRNIQEQAWHNKLSEKLDKPGTNPLKPPVPETSNLGFQPSKPVNKKTTKTKNIPGLYPLNSPPVIVRNNNNDLLTGVLIGEAISRPAPYYPPPNYTPPPSYSPPRQVERESSSSSSSWSSSSDSGSSSWGSGGGDFSGGFDSGGAGGDF